MGGNQTSESKDITVWICLDLPFWIWSISIHYRRPPDIRVKWYGCSNFPRASAFNLKHLDTLRAAVVHLSQKIWTFEFAQSFHFQFQASQYIMGGNQPSESKDIDVWIFLEVQFSISSISIHYCGSNAFQGYFDDAKESRVKQRFKNQVSSFKFQDSRFKFQVSRFKIQVSRFKNQVSKIKIQDSRFKNQEKTQSR